MSRKTTRKEILLMFGFDGASQILETEDTVGVTDQQRSCIPTRALLGYFFNGVSVEDRATFDSHLSSCPSCRKRLVVLETAVDQFIAKKGFKKATSHPSV